MTDVLETVDIPAVEILASGGPVHGHGSPPEGDFYTRDQLVAMADAHHELGEEMRAPIKIGHSDLQQLAANSGLTAGEMPALGWLDPSSFRVEDDEKSGVSKLVADAKAVPAKLAELMKVGAYRTRSSELRGYASQKTQQRYDWVVDGLSLLGANVPAIQTLDDVYRLYERAGIAKPETADVFFVRRHAAEVIWNPEDGFQDLVSDLQAALNPGPGQSTYWVSDVSVDRTRAIVSAYDNGDESWIVPFALDDQGDPTPAPSTDWIPAEQAWVTAAADHARKNLRPAESRQMKLELTDAQVAQVRENLGLDANADITAESLTAAAEQRANELAEAKTAAEDASRKLEADDTEDRVRKLEQDLETERKRSFEQRRDVKLNEALRTRELDPADIEKWHCRFETLGEEACNELLDELPKRALTRELGREGDELGDDGLTDDQRRHFESEMADVFPGYEPREVKA